jgi:amino acid transporter
VVETALISLSARRAHGSETICCQRNRFGQQSKGKEEYVTGQTGTKRVPSPEGCHAPAHQSSITHLENIGKVLIGRPLSVKHASSEQITRVEGLSALSLDALTSVAYGPEAILVVLAAAGATALHLILPITIAIVALLIILVISYRQVIVAYPHGGGAYAVSRDNFGPRVAKLAGASLIVDYTLTVAVSIAAGVGQLTSAFPSATPYTVPICLGILLVIMFLNLRGLGDGARAFLLPTLVFIVGLIGIIAVGLIHPLGLHTPQTGSSLVPTRTVEAVTVLLVLKAFSAGCSALTGVEAIANGVPLFKRPRVTRAKQTELLLGTILGVMLLGLALLTNKFHVQPRTNQTVLSQIMTYSVGRHWAYYIISLTITLVLSLAANTSFGGLPILASLLARDNYLPHLFGVKDSRLVFGNGVGILALFAAVLLVASGGDTNTLIPLYAIGVFIAFTLSQAGLVVHWRRTRGPGWSRRAIINGFGAMVTAAATLIFLFSKFMEGAWVVVIVIPLIIVLFNRIESYYARSARELKSGVIPSPPARKRTIVLVPVADVSRLTQYVLSEAISLGGETVAVTVVFDTARGNAPESDVERLWKQWSPGVPLRVLHTDYGSVVKPIVQLVDDLRARTDRQVVVLIPVSVPERIRYRLLHNQIDLALATKLRRRPDVVVARVAMEIHSQSSNTNNTMTAALKPA